MSFNLVGGLSCSRIRVRYSLCPRSEARVESHEILSMVSSDADAAAVYGDEESHEEASVRISKFPGRDRARSLQETLANSS